MQNTKIFLLILLVAVLCIGAWFLFSNTKSEEPLVTSFDTCVTAGYPVLEIYPRQCKTPDGRTYAEEITPDITYTNSSADLIKVDLPFPGSVTGKEFKILGQARGQWFFEASFPIEVLDKNGKSITIVVAQAKTDWMTENFVPFEANVKIPESYIGSATLVFKKDNPSGLPEYDASISFPITIEY